MIKIQVKVCCMASVAEARLAVGLGADAVGLVGHMPSGPGVIGVAVAAQIAKEMPCGIDTFLLTSAMRASEIVQDLAVCPVSAVQIVRHIDPGEYPKLIETAPQVRRIQVVHIEDEGALDLLARYEPFVDAFLLDSGKTFGADQQFGGTGATHNWTISRRFVESTDIPVYLAGGLRSTNVFEAITQVRPSGVDLCTGVRTDDQLDSAKLEAFMSEVLRAGQALAD
ncbi:MAG: phosphoribosylanthranilate isomerase [Arenicellales bacterium]|jgi:phosphoribosylanthranilate isomerase|nr:phosphoribosylanthranilate isomerase [Arenicellales bacterium]